jgi:uncharacterized membrane protein
MKSAAPVSDQDIERFVSALLLVGVVASGLTVLAGGVYYLMRHANDPVNYAHFHGEFAVDRTAVLAVAAAFGGRARSVIQCGLLLLIATPIARVLACFIGFARQGDRQYMVVTAIVLTVLLYSLVSGAMQG